MSYTTKPIELPLSTEKEYVLVDKKGYRNSPANSKILDKIDLLSPFKLDRVDADGWGCIGGEFVIITNNSPADIYNGEYKYFHEVIRQPQTNEFNTDSIAVTEQEEEAPQYVKLMKGGKWEFTGDKSLEDGNTVAVFNCKHSERPLPSDFFGEPEGFNVMSGVEWNNGLPPIGVECEMIFNGKGTIITPLYYDDHKSGMVMFYHVDSGRSVSSDYDWCLVENCIFRKPETPEQREERERLEAARDLYFEANKAMSGTDMVNHYSFDKCKSVWLAIADKTNYRK